MPNRKARVKWVVGGLLAAGLVALVVQAVRPAPVPVELVAVEPGPLVVAVEDDGIVRHRQIYRVAAPVSGRLLRPDIEAGDEVQAGRTVIARLRPATPEPLDARRRAEQEARVTAADAAVKAAAADIRRSEALLEDARRELERIRRLRQSDVVSAQSLEAAQQAFQARRAELEAARALADARGAERTAALAALAEGEPETEGPPPGAVEVTSPVDGVVLRLLEQSERLIPAGTPLAEVGSRADLEVAVDFLSQDAVRISAGNRVEITGWGGGTVLEGRVRRVEPAAFTRVSALGIEEQRAWVLIDITSPPDAWAALAHGFRVEARVVVEQYGDALLVPLGALSRQDGGWAVFTVAGDGTAHLRAVEIGAIGDRAARVLGGLERGDRVVIYPTDRVADGVRVQPR